MNQPDLKNWLQEQPFTVALSSGFFGFYAHAGFMAAIGEAEKTPQRIHGCSAGALIAGAWASGLSAETLAEELHNLKREHFWDPGLGPGLLKGKLFQKRLEQLLPYQRIEDCPIPLGITVFDAVKRKTVTISKGPLAQAIRASCAVPVMFHPVWIDRRPYVDGGIGDPTSLNGIPNHARVLYHHLPASRWWANADAKNAHIPQTRNLRTVCVQNLPKVGPFRLYHGKLAFDRARRFTKALLEG